MIRISRAEKSETKWLKEKEQQTDYLAVIRNDIKTKEFKNIYVLYGKEVFLINNYKQALIKNILGVDDLTEA